MMLLKEAKYASSFLPSVITSSASFVLIYLNSFVDQFYVNSDGPLAATAYSICIPLYAMIIAICASFGAGAAYVVRKHWERGDNEAANRAASNSLLYSAVLGVLVALLLYQVVDNIFVLNLEDELAEEAEDFLGPFYYLFFGIAFNSVLSALMVVCGARYMQLYCLAISLVGNIILDPIFVYGLNMGIAGNGLGTALSMTISATVGIWWFRTRCTKLKISYHYLSFDKGGLVRSFRALSYFLTKSLVNNFAELGLRIGLHLSYALSYGVPMLCAGLGYVLCSGSAPVLAPKYKELSDKGDREGALALFRGSVVVMFLMMLVFTLVVYLFADQLIHLFTMVDGLKERHRVITWTLRILCFTAPFIGLKSVCGAALAPRGSKASSAVPTILWALFRVVLFVILLDHSYRAAITYLLLEHIAVGLFYFCRGHHYIRTHYTADAPHSS